MLKIAVVDGQGGGVGSVIVRRLRDDFGDEIEIIALGTNSAATTSMLRARANKGATGENAIALNVERVDVVLGPISIIMAHSMMGELTPAMASAISSSNAKKILLPLNQEGLEVVGVAREPFPHLVDSLIERIKLLYEEVKNVRG
ncbi:MAG: DUF3842 family protein [Candidatus Magnetominusculus sp. LBB02]|nr:DUF3842 family protein [Candidatus Magnetominusculus sp. LBB02]